MPCLTSHPAWPTSHNNNKLVSSDILSLATSTYYHPLYIPVLSSKNFTTLPCHAEKEHAAAAAPNGKTLCSITRAHEFVLTPHSRTEGTAPSRPLGPHIGASQAARKITVDDEDDGDDSSSDNNAAPSQNLNENGEDAISHHSPDSPDTQNLPGAYPERLAVAGASDGDGGGEDEANGKRPQGSRSPYPPGYDERYGSVSSESEDKGEEASQAALTNITTVQDGAAVAETHGPHLTVTVQERMKENENEKEKKNEKEVAEKCPNWPHLPFVSLPFPILSLPSSFIYPLLTPSPAPSLFPPYRPPHLFHNLTRVQLPHPSHCQVDRTRPPLGGWILRKHEEGG